MNSYDGITALITDASSGIGEATAYSLAKRGANLVLTARSEDKLNEIAKSIRDTHDRQVHVFAEDLSKPNSAPNIFAKTRAEGINIELLVNNAGFGKWGEFLEFEDDCYQEMLSLNINSLVSLIHLYLPAMVERGEAES